MSFNSKITINWPFLGYREFVITDLLYPGTTFGQYVPDTRLLHYEVEYQTDDDPDQWFSLGKFGQNSAQLTTTFERAVRVKIRAVLRSGELSPWETSDWLVLYGFTADLRAYRNMTPFLGII
jgi:hypothetical protein